jgi:hypothetical protein
MAAARGDVSPGTAQSSGRGGDVRETREVDDGMVQCPHCLRRFNETSGARHIPVCKNTRAKPTTLKRGSGVAGGGSGLGSRASVGGGGTGFRR